MEYPSKLLTEIIDEISKLPGIGKRTALRLALHLLKQPENQSEALSNSILKFRKEIKHCRICHNISDTEVCEICSNPSRNHELVCVVEDVRDVMAIESTGEYKGVYHVLGGKISPIEGVGPDDLSIRQLLHRIEEGNIEEIILALSSTVDGDTTNFYLYRQISKLPESPEISTIARGIAVGEELEYADEITLARSILNRVPFEKSIKQNR
jgi:recombination protein RecR